MQMKHDETDVLINESPGSSPRIRCLEFRSMDEGHSVTS